MTSGTRTAFAIAATAIAALASEATAEQPARAICSLQQAVSCSTYERCERTLPGAVNLPALILLEPEQGVMVSRAQGGRERQSKITSSALAAGTVVVQGNDEGVPWALRIATGDGRMVFTAIVGDDSVTGFGVCSAEILEPQATAGEAE